MRRQRFKVQVKSSSSRRIWHSISRILYPASVSRISASSTPQCLMFYHFAGVIGAFYRPYISVALCVYRQSQLHLIWLVFKTNYPAIEHPEDGAWNTNRYGAKYCFANCPAWSSLGTKISGLVLNNLDVLMVVCKHPFGSIGTHIITEGQT